MAVTQQQVAQLEAAIYSGERSATYDGRTVVYRDLDEMRNLLATMKAELAGSTVAPPDALARRRTHVASDMDRGGPQASDPRLDWR